MIKWQLDFETFTRWRKALHQPPPKISINDDVAMNQERCRADIDCGIDVVRLWQYLIPKLWEYQILNREGLKIKEMAEIQSKLREMFQTDRLFVAERSPHNLPNWDRTRSDCWGGYQYTFHTRPRQTPAANL